MKCDMHIHSSQSVDGQYPAEKLIEMVKDAGLFGAVITDHNEIDESIKFAQAAAAVGILSLNGSELSTKGPERENIHMILYGITPSEKIIKDLNFIKNQYDDLTGQRIKKLEKMGFSVTMEDVKKSPKQIPSMGPTLGDALLFNGKNSNDPRLEEFMDMDREEAGYQFYIKYLRNTRSDAYVEFKEYSTNDSLSLAEENKAVPVIAHAAYSLRKKSRQEQEKFLLSLVEKGMKGVEVFSTHHSNEDITFLISFAENNDLLITGGSDFHGPVTKPGIKLGDSSVPLELLENVINEVEKLH